MKGMYFVTDDKDKKTSVLIDLKTLSKHRKKVESWLGAAMVEYQKNIADKKLGKKG